MLRTGHRVEMGQDLLERQQERVSPESAPISNPRSTCSTPTTRTEESSHIEKLFWAPVSIKLDDSGRLYVTESNRHRIQIYRRVS